MTDDLLLGASHFVTLAAGGEAGGRAVPVPARAAPSSATQPAPQPVAQPGAQPVAQPTAQLPEDPVMPLPRAVAELEARSIRQAMHATGGNKLAAARLLGISRATLYLKLPLIDGGPAAIDVAAGQNERQPPSTAPAQPRQGD